MTDSQLFDTVERRDRTPGTYAETTFQVLNRAAGDYWDQVRGLLEQWLANVPASDRSDLRGRLRKDDQHFAAAFWELYIYETLRRSGYEVVLHPELPGRKSKPDFLARHPDGAVYVEAKSITGVADVGASARRRQLLDQLNRVPAKNFFLAIEIEQIGPRALPTTRLRRELEAWLEELDPDEVAAKVQGGWGRLRRRWSDLGWELEFRPIPIRADVRGDPAHRLVGMVGPGEAHWIDDASTLKNSLKAKGSKYGELEHPLLLAINVTTAFHDDFDTVNALYGTEKVQFSRADPAAEATIVRDIDGYWGYPGRWKHSQMGGMLLGENVTPWTVARSSPTLWHHPSPSRPIACLSPWRSASLDINRIERSDPSIAAHVYFELPEEWPLGEPFD